MSDVTGFLLTQCNEFAFFSPQIPYKSRFFKALQLKWYYLAMVVSTGTLRDFEMDSSY